LKKENGIMAYVLNVVNLGDIDIFLIKKGVCTIVRMVIILKLNMVQIWIGDMALIDNGIEREIEVSLPKIDTINKIINKLLK
jgi:hypothetical protein